ncbi:MAG: 30S ribosome-binding factor RbfA [Thermodesulfobacteriota bacterium]|nr:30S ribosome-binding factor RbfA [Thermodesulfobacteriota bacterium]
MKTKGFTMGFKRADRVSDLVKAEITDILLRQVRDPRVQNVTITDVKMSDDLRQAKIYFVPMGSDSVTDEVKEGLKRATGFLKRELGKRLQLRYVPDVTFIFDTSFDYGDRIERLLVEIEK